jgi:hypothetical protein
MSDPTQSNIDVRDFVSFAPRTVVFPDAKTLPAIWLDEVSITTLNTIIAEETDDELAGEAFVAMLRKHTKILVPSITDEQIDSMSSRQLRLLCSALKRFESQGEARPLEKAPAKKAPAKKAPASSAPASSSQT